MKIQCYEKFIANQVELRLMCRRWGALSYKDIRMVVPPFPEPNTAEYLAQLIGARN